MIILQIVRYLVACNRTALPFTVTIETPHTCRYDRSLVIAGELKYIGHFKQKHQKRCCILIVLYTMIMNTNTTVWNLIPNRHDAYCLIK